ncbi:Cthe_2314 family HEPN domain-containing protein [Paenibacillus macerans]|uniref:Cthe_2314 family HEPN domain-containing protein n=1 Tax=Paenibacillus macerans TaxID=44252 RepID=UPI0022E73637|nr:Cthe_2314 family HEPN domain-containing protein [Paenibacillus macerans]MDU5949876.1 Cthe_2314 family HEPN domain-containing protein [Paenibacillus macerans]MEC0141170.1 Cthe_2314 family HEPN domain-containing protein [Paenibacillus macerans]
MLRSLLGEPPRRNEGRLAETLGAMAQTVKLLQREMKRHQDPTHDFRKLEVWMHGLITSLDELEQCLFAAAFFRKKVRTGFVDDMGSDERENYARYVFFYKDGFIRVFSSLDKLGTVLNELFDLNTSKVKTHFSYFTVLRQFAHLKVHPELGGKLTAIKEEYGEVLGVLRRRRNTEIHYMNSEMKDDLWQRHQALYGKIELEDLDRHLRDLEQGYRMVCETFWTVFDYTNRRWKKVATS